MWAGLPITALPANPSPPSFSLLLVSSVTNPIAVINSADPQRAPPSNSRRRRKKRRMEEMWLEADERLEDCSGGKVRDDEELDERRVGGRGACDNQKVCACRPFQPGSEFPVTSLAVISVNK